MSREQLANDAEMDDLAFAVDDDEEDQRANKYMLFNIGEEVYGIGIQNITEIIELQKITEVPDMPDYIKGVINLRGKVIPVMDVRLRFGMKERPSDDRTCIIIVSIGSSQVGLLVDTVAEVQDIPKKNISPPPEFHSNSGHQHYISGLGKIGDEVRILLDVANIVYDKDKPAVQELNKEA